MGLLGGRSAPTVHRVIEAVDLEASWGTDVWVAMHGHSGSRYPAALVLLRTRARSCSSAWTGATATGSTRRSPA